MLTGGPAWGPWREIEDTIVANSSASVRQSQKIIRTKLISTHTNLSMNIWRFKQAVAENVAPSFWFSGQPARPYQPLVLRTEVILLRHRSTLFPRQYSKQVESCFA